ncbi:MAG: hypothetical protein ACYDC2_01470 [Solirubrobacteraceae bacterium]
MAKAEKNLIKSLRARGVRRSTAEERVRGLVGAAKPKTARRAIADLDSVVGEFKDRLRGGPQRRSAAAKKAAATRKSTARARSESAKRGARTRAQTR